MAYLPLGIFEKKKNTIFDLEIITLLLSWESGKF